MPTPVLYAGANAKPLFTDASIGGHASALDVLFITDRAAAGRADDLPYTTGRSRSIAFGSVAVEFGEDIHWDALVRESTATERVKPLQLKLGRTNEIGRFPPIPYELSAVP